MQPKRRHRDGQEPDGKLQLAGPSEPARSGHNLLIFPCVIQSRRGEESRTPFPARDLCITLDASSPLPARRASHDWLAVLPLSLEGRGSKVRVLIQRGVRMSRSAPLIIRLARFVAGEAAPKERVRILSRATQDSSCLNLNSELSVLTSICWCLNFS